MTFTKVSLVPESTETTIFIFPSCIPFSTTGLYFVALVSILILKDVGGLTSSVLSIPKGANVDLYYKNLSSENPTALNIPEILKKALQAKIDMKIVKSENPDNTRFELNERYKPLLDELQKYADILKEPEE